MGGARGLAFVLVVDIKEQRCFSMCKGEDVPEERSAKTKVYWSRYAHDSGYFIGRNLVSAALYAEL